MADELFLSDKQVRERDFDRAERLRQAHKTGEYIDQFTTVPDNRTTEQVFSQLPACLMRDRNGKIIVRKK